MTRRIRRRYFALKIVSEQTVNERELIDTVWGAVHQLFGEYGASQVGLTLIEYDPKGDYAVVRCSHKALEMVRASIASILKIKEKPVAIHVIGVSGTLKSLRKKFLNQKPKTPEVRVNVE